jgi:type IV secretory pathway TraG/TraD family ATPase VirD4
LGVKILAGLQSIDQLNANYTNEAEARNTIAGFSSVYAFHSNDYPTREYVSRLFGKNMLMESYQNSNNQIHFEKREGHSVEDWDLISLRTGEAIVGLPGIPPFQFMFDLYTA